MANFYQGSEVKIALDLTAEGFDMDRDDFEIEVAHPRGSAYGNKTNTGTDGKVIIFREPALSDSSSSSSSSSDSSSSDEEQGTWYAIIDTTTFATGDARIIARAHIPEANASGAIRTEIAVAQLGRIVNP